MFTVIVERIVVFDRNRHAIDVDKCKVVRRVVSRKHAVRFRQFEVKRARKWEIGITCRICLCSIAIYLCIPRLNAYDSEVRSHAKAVKLSRLLGAACELQHITSTIHGAGATFNIGRFDFCKISVLIIKDIGYRRYKRLDSGAKVG